MKHTVMLTISSLLSILLLTLHVTDDIVRGISKAEPSNTALFVLVVLLYGTLVLAERRWGHVIMFLVGLFAACSDPRDHDGPKCAVSDSIAAKGYCVGFSGVPNR